MVQEGDLILCTVEKVTPTIVFVRLPTGEQATIISSEIAAGRIKNMRAHVVPNKKIVCKVLRIVGNHIDLTLRRVTSRERKEVMQKFKQDLQIMSAFNQIIKDNPKQTIEKILKDFPSLSDFIEQAKENKELIKKYCPKQAQEAIEKITERKRKQVEIKKIIKLKCLESDGVSKIKKIFPKQENLTTTYISAGKFQLKLTSEDYKTGNAKLKQILEQIQDNVKKFSCEIEIIDSKK